MTVTVRTLLAEGGLGLSVHGDAPGLDQELRWVAISELPDPTPWLQGAELLLTSGMWLTESPDRGARADAWAQGLSAAAVCAVGFGLEPWFTEVPPEIVDACAHHGLALVTLPPETPFVAVDRRVADLHAAEVRRREATVVRSQHRLVGAVGRGATAVVETLAEELPGWVAVLDVAHRVADRAGSLEDVDLDRLRGYAAQAADEGRHSLLTGHPGQPAYLVPLGAPDNRRGTLCVDASSITASAGQRARLVDTTATILSVLSPYPATSVADVVVRFLDEQDVETARRVCEATGVELPRTLVAVAVGGPGQHDLVSRALDLGMWRLPSAPGRGVALVGGQAMVEARIATLADRSAARVGVSAPHPPTHLGRAAQEAATALRLATAARPVARYGGAAASPLAAVLDAGTTRDFARSLLGPLDDHPEREALLASARAWIHAQARWDPAAASLGIHRATLRSRLKRLASVTGLDLDSPHDRLALSLALETRADRDGTHVG